MDDNPSDDDQTSCGINPHLEMYIKAKREQLSELLECLSDHMHSDFISDSTSFDDYYPYGDERSYLRAYLEWFMETSRDLARFLRLEHTS